MHLHAGDVAIQSRLGKETRVTVRLPFESAGSGNAGDLIKISMTVGGRDLAFSTCHHCEAKWWYREGEEVPLASVIGLVVEK